MFSNIKIKATFQRETDEKKLAEENKTFSLNSNSCYAEPQECADFVKNGFVVHIDKTINSFYLNSLFEHLLKHVQEKSVVLTQNTLLKGIEHQPQSLFNIASAASSQNVTAQQVLEQPPIFIEAHVCELPPCEFANFFCLFKAKYKEECKKEGLWIILKKTLSKTSVQKIVVHLVKTLEQSNLNPEVRHKLDRVYRNLQLHVFGRNKSCLPNSEATSTFALDWDFVSLGLFIFFDSHALQCEYATVKFRNNKTYLRFPVPTIPFVFSQLFKNYYAHNTGTLLARLAPLDPASHAFSSCLDLPKSSSDLFFLFLCAFEEAFWRESWHELWAYGAELFGYRDYAHHPLWSKYYVYIWGGLAVACAKQALPQKYAFVCLTHTETLASTFSDQLHVLHYKQQVMAAYGWHSEEKKVFENLVSLVPKKSKLYVNAIFVRLQSEMEHMLKHVLHMWFLRNKHPNDSRDELQSQVFRTDRQFYERCKKHKYFLHHLLSIADCFTEKEKSRLETHLFEVDLFLLVAEEIEWGAGGNSGPLFGDQGKREKLDVFFQHSSHFLSPFVSFWNNSLAFQQYEIELQELKKTCQKQTRLKDNLLWAFFGFAHLLLLKFTFNYAPELFCKNLYQEVQDIFAKHSSTHPMAMLMDKKLTNKRPHHWPVAEQHQIENGLNISFSWFIKNAPHVKTFICLGALSVARFDVTDQSSYWNE